MEDMHFWEPSNDIIKSSNIYRMMLKNKLNTYDDLWKWSVESKEDFWKQTLENLNIIYQGRNVEILNDKKGVENARWLSGAKMNIVDSCFQHQLDSTGVIIQKQGKPIQKISISQLETLVNQVANSLVNQGLKPGARLAINMPMTLEAVAIYLGGIKAGMDLVTIADSFTPNEIAIRLKITNPDLLFTADVINRSGKILPLYDKIKKAGAPATVVLNDTDLDVVRLRNEDMNWSEFLVENRTFTSVKSDPDNAITTLFSSGTTGEPKAIPWTHTTPIKSASDAYYHHNVQPGDVFCWPTNLGWMMGPWLVFASLINKAAIGLYYGAPTDSAFGAFVEKAEVNILGVIPSFVKHWKQTKCMESFNWERIKCFSSTGEVSNPSDMTYLMKLARNKPVIEYCGGTEIGGGYVTSTVVQTNIPSTFSTQALGGEFVLLDENNQPAELGEVFLIPPVMGLSTRLVNRDHHEVYYKGTPTFKGQTLRRHGDQMQQRINGYYKASGRVDDAMNLGGINVSSVQIESVLNQLDFIKECAAVSVPPKGGGPEELIVFYVELDNIVTIDDRLFAARDLIKKELNPLFKLVDLRVIDELPRTASNKVMRRKLRDQYRKD